jgi:hypothetical protein
VDAVELSGRAGSSVGVLGEVRCEGGDEARCGRRERCDDLVLSPRPHTSRLDTSVRRSRV